MSVALYGLITDMFSMCQHTNSTCFPPCFFKLNMRFSNYDAGNTLVTANQPRLLQRSRWDCLASCNEDCFFHVSKISPRLSCVFIKVIYHILTF